MNYCDDLCLYVSHAFEALLGVCVCVWGGGGGGGAGRGHYFSRLSFELACVAISEVLRVGLVVRR